MSAIAAILMPFAIAIGALVEFVRWVQQKILGGIVLLFTISMEYPIIPIALLALGLVALAISRKQRTW